MKTYLHLMELWAGQGVLQAQGKQLLKEAEQVVGVQ